MVHIKIYFKNEERKSFSGSLCWWNGTQFLITAQVPASFYFSDRHPRGYILADAIQGKVVQTRCGPSRTSGLRAHCLPARQPFQAECGGFPLLGGWRPQVAGGSHDRQWVPPVCVCVPTRVPNPPHSFSGISKAQAGSQPISKSLCGQKSPVSVGLPRDRAAAGGGVIWGAAPLVRKIPGQRGDPPGCLSCLSASLPPSPAPLCLPPLGVLLALLRGPCHTSLLAVPGPLSLGPQLPAPSPPSVLFSLVTSR